MCRLRSPGCRAADRDHAGGAGEAAGQKLEAFATLDADAFVTEVRKRRPKAAGALSPARLAALRSGYAEQATPVQVSCWT